MTSYFYILANNFQNVYDLTVKFARELNYSLLF